MKESPLIDNIISLWKYLGQKRRYASMGIQLHSEVYTRTLYQPYEFYIETDYDDIEVKYITRNEGILNKYPNMIISPSGFKLSTSNLPRDELQAKVKEKGIPTEVHYPMPLHLQEYFEYLGYKQGDFPIAELISDEIMSLPMNPYLSCSAIKYISNIFTEFNNKVFRD